MNEIIEQLKILSLSSDELSIEFESSPEEAVIIGTKNAYINAALKLLEIAAKTEISNCEQDNIKGSNVTVSNHIKYVFNEHGAAYLVCNSTQEKELISYFKE